MIPELKTFLIVSETGSFAAAAKQIGLTSAAIGAQIRRLEDDLGYRLFDRSGWSIAPTSDGLAILPAAADLIAAYDALRVRAPRPAPRKTLRIGAIATTHTTLFAPATVRLCALFPDISVLMMPGISMYLLDRLDAGELDAALIVRPPFGPMSHLRWEPLQTQDYVMVAPAQTMGDDWRDIALRLPFIRYDSRSFGGRSLDRFLRSQGVHPRVLVETEEVHTILQMVASEVGCAIVPDVLAVSLMPNIRVIPLGEQRPTREIGVMTAASATDPVLQTLLDELRAVAASSTQHSGAGPDARQSPAGPTK